MNAEEAERVRAIFGLYLEHEALVPLLANYTLKPDPPSCLEE